MKRMLRGFSLIEVILYLGLFSVMATALFYFSWNVLELGTKDQISREVLADARILSERMSFFIRNAEGIDEGLSSFDTADGELVLRKMGSSDTIRIDVQNGGVFLTETGNPSVALHSSLSKVENISFSKYGSPADHSEYISFIIALSSAKSGSQTPSQYQKAMIVKGGAFIRNSGTGL